MVKSGKILESLLSKKMLVCLFNGFTAGLPIYFLVQLIPAWLRTENVDLKTIGFFALVLLPYSFKYLWSPFVDRYVPPFFGRRRGWMLITQVLLLATMLLFGFVNPKDNIQAILYIGFIVAFFSATQDIALDAYRREILLDYELGLGNAFYANAYRVAGFIPGGLGLILADYMPWQYVFWIISAFMSVGIIHTLLIKESSDDIKLPRSLKEAVLGPFIDFFSRDGVKQALLILAFIFFYKFGDTMATALVTPFYLDLGFTKTIVGTVAKTVGITSMIAGGFLGGILMIKLGVNKSLWAFGVVQLVAILGFAVLSEVGPKVWLLGVIVAFEYLGVGLGSAALMAFIAKCTNKNFTGTQLALLTSFFAIPKSFVGIIAGILIEGIKPTDGVAYSLFGEITGVGYTNFFLICTVLGLPGMILLLFIAPWSEKETVS